MNTPRIDHTSIEEMFTKHLGLDTNKRIYFLGHLEQENLLS